MRKPTSRILYLAPWAKDAAEIASDLATQILQDAPPELCIKYNAQTKEYVFGNGSVIRLKGVNGEHAQYLRGGSADLVILDECGLMDELRHIYQDVVAPMTLTTKGRILFLTTPPVTPDHDSAAVYEELAGRGCTSTFTLLAAPHISEADKANELRRAGEKDERIPGILAGTFEPETTTAMREYFCKFVTDASAAVVPEFTAVAKQEMVLVPKRPAYFDCYVSMDPGVVDRTGILFAYWDFIQSKLVIEDEVLLRGKNTLDIARAIKVMEESLWGFQTPYRFSDIQLQLIIDLYELHGLAFSPVRKEDSQGAVNLMRNMVQRREIVIHPRCVNLIRQLENATWNNKATDFQRTEKHGHYDLVAALKYLCRHFLRHKNPYPDNYFQVGGPGGPPAAYFVPFGARRKRGSKTRGLLPDTPAANKIAKR